MNNVLVCISRKRFSFRGVSLESIRLFRRPLECEFQRKYAIHFIIRMTSNIILNDDGYRRISKTMNFLANNTLSLRLALTLLPRKITRAALQNLITLDSVGDFLPQNFRSFRQIVTKWCENWNSFLFFLFFIFALCFWLSHQNDTNNQQMSYYSQVTEQTPVNVHRFNNEKFNWISNLFNSFFFKTKRKVGFFCQVIWQTFFLNSFIQNNGF